MGVLIISIDLSCQGHVYMYTIHIISIDRNKGNDPGSGTNNLTCVFCMIQFGVTTTTARILGEGRYISQNLTMKIDTTSSHDLSSTTTCHVQFAE